MGLWADWPSASWGGHLGERDWSQLSTFCSGWFQHWTLGQSSPHGVGSGWWSTGPTCCTGGEVRHSPRTDNRSPADRLRLGQCARTRGSGGCFRGRHLCHSSLTSNTTSFGSFYSAEAHAVPTSSARHDTTDLLECGHYHEHFQPSFREVGRTLPGGGKRNFRRYATSSDWCPVHDLVGASGAVLGGKSGCELAVEVLGQGLCATSKAFDTMPFGKGGLGSVLFQRAGCLVPVIDVMKDLYSRINRRFKVLSHLGKPITAEGKRGCIQSSALSMLFCCVLTLAWFQLQHRGTTINDSRIQALSVFSPHSRRGGPSISCLWSTECSGPHRRICWRFASHFHSCGHVLTFLWAAALGMNLNAKNL